MKILWFTWKDLKNPLAGGAERVNEELAKRFVQNGDEVIFLTAGFAGAKNEEIVDGYKIIRLGNRWTVYWQVYRYYINNLQGWADLAIDESNVTPFFAKFYVKEKNILFIHQLIREIWFYQMFFPLNIIGYILEPFYLRILNDRDAITISESTKRDLLRLGFKKEKINIISEGVDIEPVEDLKKIEKYEKLTILSFGNIRNMKRTNHIVRAFELFKEKEPEAQLILAGGYKSAFGKKVVTLAKNSKYSDSIEVMGQVDRNTKIELFQKSHVLLVTSVREGWGLVVTEANSQGLPAIVYNVEGLRDSVQHNMTGIVCANNNPNDMAKNIDILLGNKAEYKRMRTKGWEWSKEITFDKSCEELKEIVNNQFVSLN